MRVLVGVQPQFTQVPPAYSRSIRAVLRPSAAKELAIGPPPCPAPITIVSNCSVAMSLLPPLLAALIANAARNRRALKSTRLHPVNQELVDVENLGTRRRHC